MRDRFLDALKELRRRLELGGGPLAPTVVDVGGCPLPVAPVVVVRLHGVRSCGDGGLRWLACPLPAAP
eukprot:426372-Heterocapsa_arctica.AAC.1